MICILLMEKTLKNSKLFLFSTLNCVLNLVFTKYMISRGLRIFRMGQQIKIGQKLIHKTNIFLDFHSGYKHNFWWRFWQKTVCNLKTFYATIKIRNIFDKYKVLHTYIIKNWLPTVQVKWLLHLTKICSTNIYASFGTFRVKFGQ